MLIAVVDTPFLALNSKLVSVCNYGWTRMGSLWGIVSFLRLTTPILLLSTCRFTSRVDGFQTISTAMTSKSLPTAGLNGNPSPVIMHAEILDDFDVSSRLIIIGDVHGCLSELKLLLLQCSYQKEKDKIVLVGDLVNKGPYSAGVIKFVREIGASCVRGNHDDAALSKALQAKTFCKDLPSHYQYLKELNDEDIEWLVQLPYTMSIPYYDALIVHAGLEPGVSLDKQRPTDMCILRTLPVENTDGSATEVPWASLWQKKDGPHVYFGHDAKRGLQFCDHATGLDTGCCYGRKLTAIILPAKQIIQVDALEVYEEPKSPK